VLTFFLGEVRVKYLELNQGWESMKQRIFLPHSHQLSEFSGQMGITSFMANFTAAQTIETITSKIREFSKNDTLYELFSYLHTFIRKEEEEMLDAVVHLQTENHQRFQAATIPLLLRMVDTHDECERVFLHDTIVRSLATRVQDLVVFDTLSLQRSNKNYLRSIREMALGECEEFDHPILSPEHTEDELNAVEYLETLAYEGNAKFWWDFDSVRFECLLPHKIIDLGPWYLSPLTQKIRIEAKDRSLSGTVIDREDIFNRVLDHKDREEAMPYTCEFPTELEQLYFDNTGLPPDRMLDQELHSVGKNLEKLLGRYGESFDEEMIRLHLERMDELRERLEEIKMVN
jgi:hypothetical protein